jgi:hypothetical protein
MKEHQPPPPFAQRTAVVNQAQAACLVDYDHHRVRVSGELGVMLTYQWLTGDEAAEVRTLIVVFPPLPIALAHPPAPPEVQTVIDQCVFD